jgi:hypothetical protein
MRHARDESPHGHAGLRFGGTRAEASGGSVGPTIRSESWRRVDLLGSQARLLKKTGVSILARSEFGRLAGRLRGRLRAGAGRAGATDGPRRGRSTSTPRTSRSSKGSARNHGFSALFLWQAAIFTKRSLTAYEREREASQTALPVLTDLFAVSPSRGSSTSAT